MPDQNEANVPNVPMQPQQPIPANPYAPQGQPLPEQFQQPYGAQPYGTYAAPQPYPIGMPMEAGNAPEMSGMMGMPPSYPMGYAEQEPGIAPEMMMDPQAYQPYVPQGFTPQQPVSPYPHPKAPTDPMSAQPQQGTYAMPPMEQQSFYPGAQAMQSPMQPMMQPEFQQPMGDTSMMGQNPVAPEQTGMPGEMPPQEPIAPQDQAPPQQPPLQQQITEPFQQPMGAQPSDGTAPHQMSVDTPGMPQQPFMPQPGMEQPMEPQRMAEEQPPMPASQIPTQPMDPQQAQDPQQPPMQPPGMPPYGNGMPQPFGQTPETSALQPQQPPMPQQAYSAPNGMSIPTNIPQVQGQTQDMPPNSQILLDQNGRPFYLDMYGRHIYLEEQLAQEKEKAKKRPLIIIGIIVGIIAVALIAVAVVFLFFMNGSSDDQLSSASSSPGTLEATEEPVAFDPTSYKTVPFDELSADPGAFIGEKLLFTGAVQEITEEGSTNTLQLLVDDKTDQVVIVKYKPSIIDNRIMEKDDIRVYGICEGSTTYETVVSSSNAAPLIQADQIELKSKAERAEESLEQYEVTLDSCAEYPDLQGAPAAVITMTFTNNSKESISFMNSLYAVAFQNGIELPEAMMPDSDEYDIESAQTPVSPGSSLKIQCAYQLDGSGMVSVQVTTGYYSNENVIAERDFYVNGVTTASTASVDAETV